MVESPGDTMVNAGIAGADRMKIQTAAALEDAARNEGSEYGIPWVRTLKISCSMLRTG